MTEATAGGAPELPGHARRPREDTAAVAPGLRLAWSTSCTAGQGTKPELRKGSGYGRTTFDLLRQRVLGLASGQQRD